VIEKHIEAMGGAKVVEGLKSIRIDFNLREPTFEVEGIYAADRQGRMRVDIFANKVRVFSEGYDGLNGWQLSQESQHGTPTSPDGTKALLHGLENQLFGLHELQSRGHYLVFTGQEVVNHTEYFVIKVIYADGEILWRYVNTTNWLIERSREQKALHPDVDPTKTIIETQFSDFREVGGLVRSFQEVQTDLSTNQILQTTVVKQIKINPPFAQDYFECP